MMIIMIAGPGTHDSDSARTCSAARAPAGAGPGGPAAYALAALTPAGHRAGSACNGANAIDSDCQRRLGRDGGDSRAEAR